MPFFLSSSYPRRYNGILLFLGLLSGVAINVNFVSSLAYFLTQHDPTHLLYLTIGSIIVVTFLMRWLAKRDIKFAGLAIAILAAICLLQALLITGLLSATLMAFIWAASAIFCRSAVKWILNELAIRHLNPSEAKITIFYNATTYEAGTFAVMFTITYIFGNRLSYDNIQWLVLGLLLLYIVVLAAFFLPREAQEVRFERTPPKTLPGDTIALAAGKLTPYAGLLFLFLGLSEMVPDYAYKYYFKHELPDFTSLQFTLANIYIYSSLILIAGSMFVTRLVRAYRISPVTLIFLTLAIYVIAASYCLQQPSVARFTVFAVVFMVLLKLCTQTASQLMLSFFPGDVRQRFTSLHTVCYWIVPNLILAVAVSYHDLVTPERFIVLLLTAFQVVCLLCLAALLAFRKQLVAFFYNVIRAERKTPTLLAVEALSYIKPSQVDQRLLELLSQNPKKLLKKNIILSLGYSAQDNHQAFERIIDEFRSGKEEVQVAIIQAICHFRGYERIKFLIDVLIGRQQKITQHVRINASKFLIHMYGRKTIPILLVGLDEQDPRAKADALEALGWLKDHELIPVFSRYISHPNARVRANAIIALIRFKKHAPACHEYLDAMLQDKDPNIVASGLYVIGYHRLRNHVEQVLALGITPTAQQPIVARGIAWSLMRANHPDAVRHFIQLFVAMDGSNESLAFLHLFSQLDQRAKFAIFEALLRYHRLNPDSIDIDRLFGFLKNSEFDFHEELNFMTLQLSR